MASVEILKGCEIDIHLLIDEFVDKVALTTKKIPLYSKHNLVSIGQRGHNYHVI